MNDWEVAQLERIDLMVTVDRHRLLLRQYEDGIRFQWSEIAKAHYRLGQLDEQLGGEPWQHPK